MLHYTSGQLYCHLFLIHLLYFSLMFMTGSIILKSKAGVKIKTKFNLQTLILFHSQYKWPEYELYNKNISYAK